MYGLCNTKQDLIILWNKNGDPSLSPTFFCPLAVQIANCCRFLSWHHNKRNSNIVMSIKINENLKIKTMKYYKQMNVNLCVHIYPQQKTKLSSWISA